MSPVAVGVFGEPVATATRVAKPVVLGAMAVGVARLAGARVALAAVALQAALGLWRHRAFCVRNRTTSWLAARSPFLYRNDRQLRLWAWCCSRRRHGRDA